MKKRIVFLSLIALILPGVVQAEKITFNDLYSYGRVGDPQVSPDGKKLAFVLSSTDTTTDENASHIMLMDLATGEIGRFPGISGEAWHPRWSPDGTQLAFAADDDEGSQFWLIGADGGQPRRVTSLWGGANGMEWSQ